ncbi:MAG: hypothetical protein KF698_09670 [Anaerolineales bacterium]|nr:hypothetical protein [Anaerolineales bacterium]
MLSPLQTWLRKVTDSEKDYWFPVVSFVLCVLAYGLLIPWLGLYWDDWPLAWSSHHFGPEVYQGYPAYRPLSGWVYYFLFSLLGEAPLGWHLLALVLRWVSGLAFFWVVRLLWPREKALAVVAGLLFLVYPGFSQQSIAVTYSVYFLYYSMFLASLALMLVAARSERAWGATLGALALGVFSMTCTEYFYGLELLRPVLLVIALRPRNVGDWKRAVIAWLPYAAMLVGVFLWRNWASQQSGALYRTVLLGRIQDDPVYALSVWAPTALRDLSLGAVMAWTRTVEALGSLRALSVSSISYIAVTVGAVIAGAVAMLGVNKLPAQNGATARDMLGLGLIALAVSGLSFWMAALPMALAFPNDRFTMPMMFGVSLIVAGLWGFLRIHRPTAQILMAVLLGLCVGFHFYKSNQFRAEWLYMEDFARQLAWRAPSLEPNTAVVSPQLRVLQFNTDNSLTGLLNWMYVTPGAETERLPHAFFYAELRGQTRLAGLRTGDPIYAPFDFLEYRGDRSEVVMLTFAYQPPACLHVLDPQIAANLPELSHELKPIIGLSDPSRIQAEASPFSERGLFWDLGSAETWCFYFQKADLARQQQDWQAAAQLGDTAFGLGLYPDHAVEYVPFIEAYARLGRGGEAVMFTEEALAKMPSLQPVLCAVWSELEAAGAGQAQPVTELLNCNSE